MKGNPPVTRQNISFFVSNPKAVNFHLVFIHSFILRPI